ncbi:NHL repeat-containing protein [Actinoplanes awajinensis]|uniref:Uncharacterized protein n=1 Tax=Actinoplanes awajinensis subsp. mycoplanecinus TaxID=135947 RepID=A0A101JSV9_9ACTN|nr:hypothetical protein [Actinoplanes awajinensis]KUL32402.1 hypothetical protein ADL15_20520 [Actinoplanes awajinensis subsp. mycoplanecinus]
MRLGDLKFLLLVPLLLLPAVPAAAAVIREAPTFNGNVHAIARRGSTVYVGGEFTAAIAAGRKYPRQRLAAYDSRTGALLPWNPAADDTVRALVTTPDAVYVAGSFHTISGKKRDSVARLSLGSGRPAPFAPAVDGTPYALAAGSGRLYLAGRFARVDGAARSNVAAFSLATGRLDPKWHPAADDRVHSLAVSGDRLYLGGGFHSVDGVRGTLRLAVVGGRTGAVDKLFLPRPVAEVNAIAVDGAGVYVATGGQGGRAVAYAFDGKLRWQRVFDGDAVAITTLDGVTYVGGHFDRACLTARNGPQGACLDGAVPRVKIASITSAGVLTEWNPQANGVIGVRVLSPGHHPSTIEAGGDFTTIDNHPRPHYVSF